MGLLQTIITVGSVFAAILAWFAKLRWSREFAAAKNATIAAKDMQIEQLKEHIKVLQEMTPMKVANISIVWKNSLKNIMKI